MAYEKFIKSVQSEKFLKEVERNLIFAKHCNRDYSGEVSQLGDQIRVDGLGDVTVYNYHKDGTYTVNGTSNINGKDVIQGNMPPAENPQGYTATFTVNQFLTFHIAIGDIDKELAKNGEGILGKYRQRAAKKWAREIDEYVASAILNFKDAQWKDTTLTNDVTASDGTVHSYIYTLTAGTPSASHGSESVHVFDFLDAIIQKLHERDYDETGDFFVECTPGIFRVIKKALRSEGGLVDGAKNDMITGTGVTEYNGLTINMSNCAKLKNGTTNEYIVVRHKDAISYWNPLTDLAAYKLQESGKGFGDAVMGYTMFDCGITAPKAFFWAKVKAE
jgi:hypothetical protein